VFLPYWLSVIFVSLALYGLWHLARELAAAAFSRADRPVSVSLLVIIRNAETTVEGRLRYLLRQAAEAPVWEEVVVADCGSEDLTPLILTRLASGFPLLKIVHLSAADRPVPEGMAFCQGRVVQVLDLVNRLDGDDWNAAVRTLLRR